MAEAQVLKSLDQVLSRVYEFLDGMHPQDRGKLCEFLWDGARLSEIDTTGIEELRVTDQIIRLTILLL